MSRPVTSYDHAVSRGGGTLCSKREGGMNSVGVWKSLVVRCLSWNSFVLFNQSLPAPSTEARWYHLFFGAETRTGLHTFSPHHFQHFPYLRFLRVRTAILLCFLRVSTNTRFSLVQVVRGRDTTRRAPTTARLGLDTHSSSTSRLDEIHSSRYHTEIRYPTFGYSQYFKAKNSRFSEKKNKQYLIIHVQYKGVHVSGFQSKRDVEKNTKINLERSEAGDANTMSPEEIMAARRVSMYAAFYTLRLIHRRSPRAVGGREHSKAMQP